MSLLYPSHASIKRKALTRARPYSCPCRICCCCCCCFPLVHRMYTYRQGPGHQSIASLRKSRRDARELLLSIWDGGMDCPLPAAHNRIAYRDDISSGPAKVAAPSRLCVMQDMAVSHRAVRSLHPDLSTTSLCALGLSVSLLPSHLVVSRLLDKIMRRAFCAA